MELLADYLGPTSILLEGQGELRCTNHMEEATVPKSEQFLTKDIGMCKEWCQSNGGGL